MMWRKTEGYTLIEIILVVSIMTIIIPIMTRSYLNVLHHQQLNHFINELKSVLYDAQMSSIATGDYTKVVIDQPHHNVYIIKGVSNKLNSFSYSKLININCGTHGCQIVFTPTGHMQNPGTIFFSLNKEQYKLVLLLGQGRFYVEKL